MAIDTSKNSYTIIFSILMVLVVGGLLSLISSSLSDKIKENKKVEKMQNILFAIGVTDADDKNAFVDAEQAEAKFVEYIGEEQYIITGATAVKSSEAFKINNKKEGDKVKADAGYERQLELYIGTKDGKTSYVVSMRGNGLWDAVWAYMALNKDMVIQGAFFDHAGETPGLGANIKESFFRDDFIGEHLKSADGTFKGVTVKKGNADPKNEDKLDNEVDAMAGATITGDGITAMVKKGLGMYVPYFEKLKNK